MPALQLFTAAAWARTYPRVAWLFRSRVWLVQETLLPILAVSASAMSYEAMDAPKAYAGVVILGAAMTTFWLNVLWGMGAQLYWERDSGNLELYIMSPAPITAILTGMALGGMTTTLIRAVAITTAGVLLFGVPLEPTSWWLLAAVFLLTLAALYGLGMMFASLFLLWGREAWHIVSALQEPVYLVSGVNFPLANVFRDGRAKMVAIAAAVIPLTAGVDGMRQVLFRTPGLLSIETEMTILSVLAVAFIAVARRCLRLMERWAKEEGKLTIRWQ